MGIVDRHVTPAKLAARAGPDGQEGGRLEFGGSTTRERARMCLNFSHHHHHTQTLFRPFNTFISVIRLSWIFSFNLPPAISPDVSALGSSQDQLSPSFLRSLLTGGYLDAAITITLERLIERAWAGEHGLPAAGRDERWAGAAW